MIGLTKNYKFKSIILTKNKSNNIPPGFSVGTDIVSIEKSVKLLGIHLDNRLNFNLHINTISQISIYQICFQPVKDISTAEEIPTF